MNSAVDETTHKEMFAFLWFSTDHYAYLWQYKSIHMFSNLIIQRFEDLI